MNTSAWMIDHALFDIQLLDDITILSVTYMTACDEELVDFLLIDRQITTIHILI